MIPGAPTLEKPRAQPQPAGPDGGGASGGFSGDGAFDRSGGDGHAPAAAGSPAVIGVWLLVGAIIILFAAFTSTFLARRAMADWRVGPLPAILWLNTTALLASSATMEWARAGIRRGHLARVRRGLAVTTLLGAAFLIGQVVAWRQLVDAGVFLASGAHSGFFYLLTGTHALHLAGGVAALGYASWTVHSAISVARVSEVLAPTAIYWHFVDALWVYVFLMLFWL